jgi:hypothetical protein
MGDRREGRGNGGGWREGGLIMKGKSEGEVVRVRWDFGEEGSERDKSSAGRLIISVRSYQRFSPQNRGLRRC